ncbi:16818_t:CDS:2 [Funneliformis mosseae]|uniref:16818_t:CDS:1 n=1 Tax=Funneliformis mosseae TaxID=27381 RepID=A0A9N8WJ82_FUNMO|nr:16818_t:CDS:2 [Funneliformis mosseae]
MEEASKQRKERLEALRKRKLGNEPENNKEEVKEEGKNEKLPLKFRNYTPINEDIKAISKINISTPKDITETLEKTVEEVTKQVKEEEEKKREEEVDLFNLAPKKPNWDLKRDVEKKLAKLDKITQASIAELIRIRLQGESNENSTVDLVDAINAQQKADTDGEVSD